MNIFAFNLDEKIEEILESYINVMGRKYQYIIYDRLKKILFFPYYNHENILNYYDDLLRQKSIKLGIKFLKQTEQINDIDVNYDNIPDYIYDLLQKNLLMWRKYDKLIGVLDKNVK